MAKETPDQDMDLLHARIITLGDRIHRLRRSIQMDNRQQMEDAWLAVDGAYALAIAHLDDIIPGGCPSER